MSAGCCGGLLAGYFAQRLGVLASALRILLVDRHLRRQILTVVRRRGERRFIAFVFCTECLSNPARWPTSAAWLVPAN